MVTHIWVILAAPCSSNHCTISTHHSLLGRTNVEDVQRVSPNELASGNDIGLSVVKFQAAKECS